MKTLLTSVMAMFVWLLFAPPVPARAQIGDVYVVCRKFVAERNCYKCSDYFHVRSEDEAKKNAGEKVTVKQIILDPWGLCNGGSYLTAPVTTMKRTEKK